VGTSAAGAVVGTSAAGALVGAAVEQAASTMLAISKIEKTIGRRFISFFSPWGMVKDAKVAHAGKGSYFTSLF